ncbi:hatching enzyme 1.2-like [Daktulosphaira vitifoliae]|uniref:hatching enzyme 1.2-like n=1 Tax=Daktulosphaira vitifoliae TaxID=58002 RepID=UPI0021AA7C53|nr:hatching enzyme 1.2-like [Daktulosphaira vitifoliae]
MFNTSNFRQLAFIVLTALAVIQAGICRNIHFKLPNVPDIVHPPIPSETEISTDDLEAFESAEDFDPEVKPGLFQGDMALNNEIFDYWRVGLRWDIFPEKLWLNRTVPYLISPLYETEHRLLIYKAIRTLNFFTCIKFVPWNGKLKDYLLIWPVKYPAGCWSYVGRYGGPQIVSLQPPDETGPNCLGTDGRPIHELMHALGIFHEQSRADRDKFVKINFENILPRYRSNFDKQSLKNTTYEFEYDYDSVMHYGKNFFSVGKGKPTMEPKIPGKTIGQRKMLSKTDCLKINNLYDCLGTAPKFNRKYYMLCNHLEI